MKSVNGDFDQIMHTIRGWGDTMSHGHKAHQVEMEFSVMPFSGYQGQCFIFQTCLQIQLHRYLLLLSTCTTDSYWRHTELKSMTTPSPEGETRDRYKP